MKMAGIGKENIVLFFKKRGLYYGIVFLFWRIEVCLS